jgi:thymidylate synthase
MEIKRSSLKDTWLLSCYSVLTKGKDILDERGKNTKEIRNLVMKITNPTNYWNNVKSIYLPKDFYFNREALEEYCNQLLDKDNHGFIYSYGNRLRSYFDIDQIDEATEKLQKNQNTRRAFAITIDPINDNKQIEIPCLQNIVFLIRDSRLYMTAFFRSNDIGMAAFANQYGLINLGCYMSDKLGIQMGELTVHSVSAHIYETDTQAITQILEKNGWII